MNRNEALQQMAAALDLNADDLINFANEDQVGGRDTGAWDGMSTFEAEGQFLYALTRALKPEQVVEVGVDSGGTSTHILSALARNGDGLLYSVDINPDVGAKVPAHLRGNWTLVTGDALSVQLPAHAAFIFEDGSHDLLFTKNVLARLKTLNPRILVSHDYYTHEVYGGFYVKEAFDSIFADGFGVKIDGAFTGFGVWVNPDWHEAEPELIEDTTPVLKPRITAPKAKRKAGKHG
jgi:hypothetical protein